MAIMAMTTRSSMRVKAGFLLRDINVAVDINFIQFELAIVLPIASFAQEAGYRMSMWSCKPKAPPTAIPQTGLGFWRFFGRPRFSLLPGAAALKVDGPGP